MRGWRLYRDAGQVLSRDRCRRTAGQSARDVRPEWWGLASASGSARDRAWHTCNPNPAQHISCLTLWGPTFRFAGDPAAADYLPVRVISSDVQRPSADWDRGPFAKFLLIWFLPVFESYDPSSSSMAGSAVLRRTCPCRSAFPHFYHGANMSPRANRAAGLLRTALNRVTLSPRCPTRKWRNRPGLLGAITEDLGQRSLFFLLLSAAVVTGMRAG